MQDARVEEILAQRLGNVIQNWTRALDVDPASLVIAAPVAETPASERKVSLLTVARNALLKQRAAAAPTAEKKRSDDDDEETKETKVDSQAELAPFVVTTPILHKIEIMRRFCSSLLRWNTPVSCSTAN